MNFFRKILVVYFYTIHLVFSICHATTHYVDISLGVSGDGTSWDAAFLSIDDALSLTTEGDNVFVAEGTYVEPYSTLVIRSGVKVYGGFPSGGGTFSQRESDPRVNPTIISEKWGLHRNLNIELR